MSRIHSASLDRDRHAQSIRKDLGDSESMRSIIASGRELSRSMQQDSTDELVNQTRLLEQRIRSESRRSTLRIGDENLTLAIAIVQTALARVHGITLFDTQWLAGIVMSSGGVAEMQTGEGKTLAAVLPTFLRSLLREGVHVVLPNAYLASRDYRQLAPVFEICGLSCGIVKQSDGDEVARRAYQCDVTYGVSHSFGFDYLRDQLQRRKNQDRPIGQQFLSRLRAHDGQPADAEALQCPRGRYFASAIIDEADDVLLDDAVSPLVLSGSTGGESGDADVHRTARRFSDTLIETVDFVREGDRRIELTEAGFDLTYQQDSAAFDSRLLRPWHEYVETALQAKFCYQRNVHYLRSDDDIRLIDSSTGRVFADRTWAGGLHQAVQAREDLPIRPESDVLARITKQRFFRSYRFLAGMTGTADACYREFETVYGMPVIPIPPRSTNLRDIYPPIIARNHVEKLDRVVAEAIEMARLRRPVLIGTFSVRESLEIASRLAVAEQTFELLNGIQDAEEAVVIAAAGRAGAITVATNLAGRGTDIRLDEQSSRNGGLHVIVTQMHSYARVDRQLIGRAARCGDPGSCRTFISPDDPLIHDHAPWIARHLQRNPDPSDSQSRSLQDQVANVQARLQRVAMAWRTRLLENDEQEQSLIESSARRPDACWAM